VAFALGRRIGLRARLGGLLTGDALQASETVPWWAVAAAALTPAVLTAGWLIGGALQPAPYNLVRDTVSSLAGLDGTDRWIMTDALLLVGVIYLVMALGLACLRAAARMLLVVAGMCSFGIAAAPVPATGPTPLHLAWTVLGAVTLTFWPAVTAWRARPRTAVVSAGWTVAVTIAFTAMLIWTLVEVRGGPTLGLAERSITSVQTTWPLVVALLVRRRAGLAIGR
jgi:hypothetical protein